ncbi:MAG TPA: Hsp20/alpha crystallin family protein [Actinomycetales bacterium]|nr:Hsp20/alpha crystallin family protein [Actinomycetales bacterium]
MSVDPFREMDRLASQLFGQLGTSTRNTRWMPMDLFRAGDHYVVNVDLPGVDPGSIDLDVDGTMLTIRASRTVSSDESAKWLVQERPSGNFVRQIGLGEGLDVAKIDATYTNGVLCLTIPIAEQAKPRKIEVRAAAPQRAVTDEHSGETVSGQVTSSQTT